jgi:hypothetical protein
MLHDYMMVTYLFNYIIYIMDVQAAWVCLGYSPQMAIEETILGGFGAA